MIARSRQTLKENRCGLLLAILFLFLMLHPFTVEGGAGRILFGVLGTVVLLSAVYAVSVKAPQFTIAIILALIASAGSWTAEALDTRPLWMLADLLMTISYGYVTMILLGYVLRGGHITADKLFASVCVFIFFGLIWARTYHAVEIAIPGSFTGISGNIDVAYDDLTYFSFVTLTSLGYGDIAPKNPQARCFVILEAIIGVLYLAILISRLAGQYRRQKALTEKE